MGTAERKLQGLPIGIQTFEKLRNMGKLYVDKTSHLVRLAEAETSVFLARPRRFGKSLTLSTLSAMFSGKAELFQGLAAEAWVAKQAEHPSPVLRFDMSALSAYSSGEALDRSLVDGLENFALMHGLELSGGNSCGAMLQRTVQTLYRAGGPVVVLIDEYDHPILDNIGDPEKAEEMRMVLRSFYTVLKSCDEYLRFVMLTGISRFSKVGVFSAMNNLRDISMSGQYGDIVGYTQEELERDFAGWLDCAAEKMKLAREELLERTRSYYDGFCFDGVTRLYNPFSVMSFLNAQEFGNYWYESGSPSFIVTWMRRHGIGEPEDFRHIRVSADFVSSREIERAKPESFLYQAGYLTIESREEQELTLDYSNREVLNSISRMYLENVYGVEGCTPLGSNLWRALRSGDVAEAVRLYNTALAGIPYEDFRDMKESFYRSAFLMLLRGAGITANGEVHTARGRSDVLVQFPDRVVVLEFKVAKTAGDVERLSGEGRRQILDKGYARPFDDGGRALTAAVIVVNATAHEATAMLQQLQ